MPPRPGRVRRRRRARRIVLTVFCLLLLAVAAAALLLARDARAASTARTAAGSRAPALQQALAGTGDTAGLDAELAALQRNTSTARQHTDGPLWTVGAHLPVVGPNIDAVARLSATLDDVAHDVAPALVAVRDTAGKGRTPDGAVDLAALRALAPPVHAADASLTAARERLTPIDPTRLISRLAEPFVTLRDRLAMIADTLATADRATTLLPPMLGADGPRTYVLLAMTNAELRANGGIPGALVLLRADGGRVEMVREVAGWAVGPFAAPVLPLDAEQKAIFTDRPARFVQDVTMTPDFPTTAALTAEMWARAQGDQVDGVLATDPVALAHLLRATGPVTVKVPAHAAAQVGARTITVSADNAVELLENQVYGALGPFDADAVFGQVVAAVMTRLDGADVTPAALATALGDSAREHRLLVWSAHEDEQAGLADTVLAGAFLSSPRAADAVGIFFDDALVGKMSWYLDTSVKLVSSVCTPDGRRDTIDVTLGSKAPADAATSLPPYVRGIPSEGAPPGTVRTVLRVAGAQGAPTPRFERDGTTLGMDTHELAGRSFASGTITLAPGESTTVRIEALATPAASRGAGLQPAGTLDVWSTPTAHAGGLQTVPVPVCR
jgi:hypothetical protein